MAALQRELADGVEREFELTETRHREAGVEPRHRPDLGVATHAERLGLHQVVERFGVLPQLERRQPAERERELHGEDWVTADDDDRELSNAFGL